MAYCVLRVDKLKSVNKIRNAQGHNKRTAYVPNADPDRTIMNRTLVGTSDDYVGAWRSRLTNCGATYRANSVLAFDVLMTFSPEALNAPGFNLNVWERANINWLKATFGADNILTAELHLDESTPHIHALIAPIDKRGHLCAKSFIDGPSRFRKLQDEYAEAMTPLGLERGKVGSKARHKTAMQRAAEIESELQAGKMAVPARGGLDDHEYIRTLTERCQMLALTANQRRAEKEALAFELKQISDDMKRYDVAHEFMDALIRTEGYENAKRKIKAMTANIIEQNTQTEVSEG